MVSDLPPAYPEVHVFTSLGPCRTNLMQCGSGSSSSYVTGAIGGPEAQGFDMLPGFCQCWLEVLEC